MSVSHGVMPVQPLCKAHQDDVCIRWSRSCNYLHCKDTKFFAVFQIFRQKFAVFFAWYIYGTCYDICLKNIYHAAKPLCIEVSAHLWYMGTCFLEFLWKQLMACQLLVCISMRILHINPLPHPFYRLEPPSHPFGGAKWVT